jgi:hypothetical protein
MAINFFFLFFWINLARNFNRRVDVFKLEYIYIHTLLLGIKLLKILEKEIPQIVRDLVF